jgi:hypothetical protein
MLQGRHLHQPFTLRLRAGTLSPLPQWRRCVVEHIRRRPELHVGPLPNLSVLTRFVEEALCRSVDENDHQDALQTQFRMPDPESSIPNGVSGSGNITRLIGVTHRPESSQKVLRILVRCANSPRNSGLRNSFWASDRHRVTRYESAAPAPPKAGLLAMK